MTGESYTSASAKEGGAPTADPVMLYDQQALDAAGLARAEQLPAKHLWLAVLVIALLTAAGWPSLLADSPTGSAANNLRVEATEGRRHLSPFTDENDNLRMP